MNEKLDHQAQEESEGPEKIRKISVRTPSEVQFSSRTELSGGALSKSQESVDSYNPFEHRNISKPTSNVGALAHMLKVCLGSGILAMPMAFKNAGLVLGAIGTVILGIICTHCVQMLVRNSQVLCKRCRVPLLSYPKTMEMAFETGPKPLRKLSKPMRIIVTAELLISFILGNTVYVVFMSETMHQRRPLTFNDVNITFATPGNAILKEALTLVAIKGKTLVNGGYQCLNCRNNKVIEHHFDAGIHIRFYILMLWLPLTCMCMFESLKSLVPFSIIANTFVVVSFSITTYYIFRDINPPDSVSYVAPPQNWPFFLATVIFAIEGIGTILPIENEMRHPENFLGKKHRCGVVHIAMTIVVLLYGLIGFFGYLEYGDEVKGSITLNLPLEEILAQTVKILIAFAIFFTYALQFYVPINIILDYVKEKIPIKWLFWANLGVRAGLVTLTIIASITIPTLEPIITLVGSICFSTLGLLFPSIVDTIVRWGNLGRWQWRFYKNTLISLLSLIALVSGTYGSILEIIQNYE